MARRLSVAVAGLLLIASACATGYCATAKKAPVKKAPASKPAEVKWVEKSVDDITLSVPSNWKERRGMPNGAAGWYVGANADKPDAAIMIITETTAQDWIADDPTARKVGPAAIGSLDATEYAVDDSATSYVGVAIISSKPDGEGRWFALMAMSSTGQWKKYEATGRKILASVKIESIEAAAKIAEAKWVEKTVGRATLSVPEHWKRQARRGDGSEVWYVGRNLEKADAYVNLEFWSQFPESVVNDLDTKKIGAAKIGDVAATEYLNIEQDSHVFIAEKPEADGTWLGVILGSETGQWSKHQAIFRKILASAKIKPVANVEAGWVKKTVGRFTLTLPRDWKLIDDPGGNPGEYAWYVGSDVLRPDCGIVMAMDMREYAESLISTPGVVKVGPTRVSALPATEYALKDKSHQGIIVVSNSSDAEGRRFALAAASMTGKWDSHEGTVRKILASIEIRPAAAK